MKDKGSKNFMKFLSVVELIFSLMWMYGAGRFPAKAEARVLISVLFGIGAWISLGICE